MSPLSWVIYCHIILIHSVYYVMWIRNPVRYQQNKASIGGDDHLTNLFTNMYRGPCGEESFWGAVLNAILKCKCDPIWCSNVKEGVMLAKISFKKLFESSDPTVGYLSNVATNNTKTTLSHSAGICNSNYDVWSTNRNPQCETGTRGFPQRAIVMTLLFSSAPYKQKMEIRGCTHDHDTAIITRAVGGAP